MILLDTDHLSVLRYRASERAVRLAGRLALASVDGTRIGTTVANVEVQMRGWLATLGKEKEIGRQIAAYRELAELFTFFSGYHIALLDEEAATRFSTLRAAKVRIGTPDLKTASIALTQNALLLTANKRDFEQGPGLRFENWLD